MSIIALFFITSLFLIMGFIGVPIGIALSLSPVLYLVGFTDFELTFIAQSFFTYLDSFIFIAAPLFLLGGKLSEVSGILDNLFDFIRKITVNLTGGIGVGFMICAIMFGAITGLSVASAAALSVLFLPIMRKFQYGDAETAGMICAGGGLAMLIPPSLPLIVYGSITGTSVVSLFKAGIIPGLTMGSFFVIHLIYFRRKNEEHRKKIETVEVFKSFKGALGAIVMPFFIFGLIYCGVATPTEAAGVMIVYVCIYGSFKLGREFICKIPETLHQTMLLTSKLWFLMGGAGILSHVLIVEQIPHQLVDIVMHTGMGPRTFLFVLSLFFLFLGMFMDGVSLLVILMPIVFPIAESFGIHPVFLGILAIVNIEMAVITPPVGLNLYTVSSISGVPITTVVKGSIPYLIIMALFLTFIIFFPGFVLLLK